MQEFFSDFCAVQNNIKICIEVQRFGLLMEDAKFHMADRRLKYTRKSPFKESLIKIPFK